MMIVDWVSDKIKSGIADIAADYISALPILMGIAIGVYALCSMFSRGFAKLAVVGVFGYGLLIVLF